MFHRSTRGDYRSVRTEHSEKQSHLGAVFPVGESGPFFLRALSLSPGVQPRKGAKVPINKILAEYLDQYHKGEANAVTSRELEYAFGMRGSELRRAVNALRVERIPICSFEGGYYYAATSEEIRRTALQLQSRVNKIAAAARGMIGALPDYEDTGQLSLPLEGGDSA